MRIGIEAQRIFKDKKHGMEVATIELIKALQQIDSENEYFVFTRNPLDKDIFPKKLANFHFVRIKALSFPTWEQFQLPRIVKKYNLDLLHCTANTGPLALKLPLLLTLHDIIYLEVLRQRGSYYQIFGNWYRRWIVPFLVKRTARIITVSESEKARISGFFDIPGNKIDLVYNGVNEIFAREPSEKLLSDFKSLYRLPDFYMLFFGNTDPRKNTRGVLEAYYIYVKQTSNPVKLVITGLKKSEINNILSDFGDRDLLNNIIVLDYLPFKYLPLLYRFAQLFLYPSLREGFGMPVLEAMASGTPVLTSNTSSMPEVAGDAALMVDPSDPNDIAMGIQQILNQSDLRQELVRKGLLRYKNFTWQSSGLKLQKIYKDFQTYNSQ
ncbi:MAG: glycosyltransferase family 4 protein [Cyclobacteriaceae bacterium]|nr:glycosyltransferase family 4 protein [Cyclobacteriaceae bacterium]